MVRVIDSSINITWVKMACSPVRTALGGQECLFHTEFEKSKINRTEVSFFRQKCPFTDRSDLFFVHKTEVSFF